MSTSGDILLYENGNGGEIAIVNNDIALGEQLFQQCYLCLFGGNVEASTRGDEIAGEVRLDWWGNSILFQNDPAKQFNSETERTLNSVALNSSGRVAIQNAVTSDLSYFGSVAQITVNVVILSHSRVQIIISLTQPVNQQGTQLQITWDNAKREIIIQRII